MFMLTPAFCFLGVAFSYLLDIWWRLVVLFDPHMQVGIQKGSDLLTLPSSPKQISSFQKKLECREITLSLSSNVQVSDTERL